MGNYLKMLFGEIVSGRKRRQLLAVVVVVAVAWGWMIPGNVPAAETSPERVTYTYKTVGDLPIRADVFRLPGDDVRPVVVWIHGGGLITGGRGGPPVEQRERLLHAGFAIVSIDYRLAPETKLPAILEDVRDSIAWVRAKGPELFQIDPQRLAVAGISAGGYLTLMAGFSVDPRPQALIAISGYGDVDGDWYARPHEIYRQTRPLFTKAEAYQAIGKQETTKSVAGRSNFYTYCRQNGLWPQEVVGFNPARQPREFNRFSPVRNVTKDYPPTLLVHGDKDIDVPYAQSVDMAAELNRAGVAHELITLAGGGHGFGGKGLEHPEVSAAFDRIVAFLKNHASSAGGNGQAPPASDKSAAPADEAVDDAHIKAAADKGLNLLYQAGRNWQESQTCFSCHHQTLPMFAVLQAGPRGFPVDVAWMKSQADLTHTFFQEQIGRMNAGKHVAGGASTVGFGLWSLLIDQRPPDETTAAMVGYLLQTQGRPWMDTRKRADEATRPLKLAAFVEGLWLTNCSRPPLTASRIGTTVLALMGIQHFAAEEQLPAVEQAAAAAEKWLAKAPLRSAEDHFWRLWGLHQFGGDAAAQQKVREAIVAAQHEDGGWAQDQGLASDAYATGQMLFVLLETGTNRNDPVAERAAAFLLRSQHADGSWLVNTRVKSKAQPYFDNGDPHGEHQFLCVAATSWATVACLRMLPPKAADR